jgi:Flp pilus assembly pilin Flp
MRHAAAALETTWHTFRHRARADHGQDLVEYGLLAALVSIFVMATVTSLGRTITDTFWGLIVEGFPGG